MGSACCVPARNEDLTNRTTVNTLHRNVRCSPTWSFRWENRRRVAGEIDDSPYQTSHGLSRDVSVEMKGPLGSDRGNLSDEVSLHESYGTPVSLKSPVHERMSVNLIPPEASGPSIERRYQNDQVKKSADSSDITELSAPKLSNPLHSSFSTPGHPLPPSSTPSRWACRSPGHRLLRQISDSRILGLKSPNNYSVSEGRSSFVLSTCSHDLAMGSHGGSSDGWSMRTFSELVASSQRERWSFDSEQLGYGLSKVSGCSSRFSSSPSLDLQTCGACSKYLTERVSLNALSVVAVLVCGHVYHAECLETMTLEVDKYDPACPICIGGEKHVSKTGKRTFRGEAELKCRSHKISRTRVVDSSLDNDSDDISLHKNLLRGGSSKMGPSSSGASSSRKPFLRRFGSKWRSLSENDSSKKKGFWSRYRKY
ncbi:RING/U-box superfamily protein [Euphorbia peplus]|nr:RING/U-box superfamily protein [Euphorbia peplus]